MSTIETHKKKFEMFKADAENEQISTPTRIEAYFNASFHLIELCAATKGIHINKHQMVRRTVENQEDIFKEHTEDVWRAFQELENQIRPGQIYGGAINGEKLRRAKALFEKIERLCKYESKE